MAGPRSPCLLLSYCFYSGLRTPYGREGPKVIQFQRKAPLARVGWVHSTAMERRKGMDQFVTDRSSRQLAHNEELPQADICGLWQLESGALRIDSAAADGSLEFSHLALPGDYLGVDNLVGHNSRLAVRAITPARLVPVTVLDEEQRIQVLTDAFVQGRRRCREVLSLRTGESAERITRLIHLLAHSEHGAQSGRIACTLPSLKEMAFLVSLTPESVCRVVSALRQTEQLSPKVRRPRVRRSARVVAPQRGQSGNGVHP